MYEESLLQIDHELLSWPGMHAESGRFNSTTYKLGRKEIGHIHRNGVADLPFPRGMYEELIAAGRVQPHQFGAHGFVSFPIGAAGDFGEAISLFRLNYDRAREAASDHESS